MYSKKNTGKINIKENSNVKKEYNIYSIFDAKTYCIWFKIFTFRNFDIVIDRIFFFIFD